MIRNLQFEAVQIPSILHAIQFMVSSNAEALTIIRPREEGYGIVVLAIASKKTLRIPNLIEELRVKHNVSTGNGSQILDMRLEEFNGVSLMLKWMDQTRNEGSRTQLPIRFGMSDNKTGEVSPAIMIMYMFVGERVCKLLGKDLTEAGVPAQVD